MPQYPNRTDLRDRPTYGDAKKAKDAKKAVPVGPSPTDMQAGRPTPGSLLPLSRPTERPAEPITAGANFGPGPDMMQAGIPLRTERQRAIDELRAIASINPTGDLLDILDKYGNG